MAINARKWGPLVAAIVLGGIAAKAGYDVVSRKPTEKVVLQKVTRVVVAKDDIAPGASLRPEDVTLTSVPEATVTTGTFDAPERIKDRVTTVAVRKGQPIFETMLAPEGSSRGLTAIVPVGMRAVTMEINEYSGVAGLIVPGCRVDVVSTFPNEAGQMMTKTVCTSLQIVAVGRKYSEPTPGKDSKEKPPVPRDGETEAPLARSVTLLVTPHEAEILDLAAHTGTPRLILRSSRDDRHDSHGGMSDGISVAELRDGKKAGNNWISVLTNFLAPIGNPQVATIQKPVEPTPNLSDPLNLFGPTTRPAGKFREVTVIRATKEETIKVQEKEPRHGVVVDNDNTDAVPSPRQGE